MGRSIFARPLSTGGGSMVTRSEREASAVQPGETTVPQAPAGQVAATQGRVAKGIGRVFLAGPNADRDGEREQAVIRLGFGLVVLGYAIAVVGIPELGKRTGMPGATIPATLFAYATLVFVWTCVCPGPSTVRRIVALVADLTMVSVGLAVADELSAPWFPVYLWVTFGNAIRFGLRYLFAGMALSVIGFSTVLATSSYWAAHLPIGLGLLAGLVLLPLYTARLLRSLNEAVAEAREASLAKSRFLANMSHELRTPLNGVIAMSDILAATPLADDQREMACTIQTSAHALLDLIDQILDISKIEAGKMDLERRALDLVDVIASTVEILRPRATAKGLELRMFIDPALPVRVLGCPTALRQVILNLGGNATKFTERGGVDLRAWRASSEFGPVLRFEVIDTGIGIPDEAADRIFEPFAQADESATRQHGGTGLGTTIARQLTEMMGGRIGFDSQPDRGTRFWFDLPLVEVSREEAAHAHPRGVVAVGLDADQLRELDAIAGAIDVAVESMSDAEAAATRLHAPAFIAGDSANAAILVQRLNASRPSAQRLVLGLAADRGALEDFADAGCVGAITVGGGPSELESALRIAGRPPVTRSAACAPSQAPHRHILLAEDNPTNQRVARMILERAGHTVEVVADGKAALDRLATSRFDLAIVDLHMPEIDGVDVARIHRAANPDSLMPFVLLTADATSAALHMSEAAGIDAHVTKPVRPAELQEVVRRLTSRSGEAEATDSSHADRGGEARPRHGVLDEELIEQLEALDVGRGGFLDEIAGAFREDAERYCEAMGAALATGDLERFAAEAHRLKGAAASIGATALVEHCRLATGLRGDAFAARGTALLGVITREARVVRHELDARTLRRRSLASAESAALAAAS